MGAIESPEKDRGTLDHQLSLGHSPTEMIHRLAQRTRESSTHSSAADLVDGAIGNFLPYDDHRRSLVTLDMDEYDLPFPAHDEVCICALHVTSG